MVSESFNFMMEAIIREHILMIKNMDMANLFGQIMSHMKECGILTTSKVKESLFLRTEKYMKEIFKIN